MQADRFLRKVVVGMALAGAFCIHGTAGPPQAAPVSPEPAAFHEFTGRVQEYLKLHKDVPLLRTTKQRKEIVERRSALAQSIRHARANAKPGDIFTPEVSAEFQRVIRSTFQGANARKTVHKEDAVVGVHPSINGDYPEDLPLTTVPPTLLLRLPRLPAEVAYRIIGRDFVLEDTEARLIVDFIPGIIP